MLPVSFLEVFRIEREIPDEADREKINEIIFKEMVNGIFAEGLGST